MSTFVPYIPENAPFSPQQRQWLNGYLAGLYSMAPFSGAEGVGATPQLAPPTPVTILFGSQTGTAEGVAREAADRLSQSGCNPVVIDMDDYEVGKLPDERHLLVVCSTYGDGEMPDNARGFWDALSAEDAPRLEQTSFSVLALGDTSYETYCTAGKDIDSRLETLGANRLHNRIDCDVDFEEPFELWMSGVLEVIGKEGTDNSVGSDASGANGAAKSEAAAWTKKNPYEASLITNRLLTGDGSSKETRHYEIALGDSGITYTVGDALYVMPVNSPELVAEVMKALGVEGDAELEQILTYEKEIKLPSKDFLAAVVEKSDDNKLGDQVKDADFMYGKDIVDFLEDVPGVRFTKDEFVSVLKPLQARAYSISSSLAKHPGEVHLTVASVRYEANSRNKEGVCSCFLADRAADATVRVWVHANKAFGVPVDDNLPMIMVGPGTGLAPFRAFLEERESTGANGKNWLFFGDRNESSDYLYREEMEAMVESGVLNRIDLAWSRDQDEKVYVQDLMKANGAELFAWLEEGGYFFVCGDAYRMAKDVEAALLEIIAEHGGLDEAGATDYLNALRKAKRYVRDVY